MKSIAQIVRDHFLKENLSVISSFKLENKIEKKMDELLKEQSNACAEAFLSKSEESKAGEFYISLKSVIRNASINHESL